QKVPSYRHRKAVSVDLNGWGSVTGDVAWGGSWFFLVNEHSEDLSVEHVDHLTDVAQAIRRALSRDSITGPDGQQIQNVALFGPPRRRDANSRNFVLPNGKSYGPVMLSRNSARRMACATS